MMCDQNTLLGVRLLLAVALVVNLAACGGNGGSRPDTGQEPDVSAPEPEVPTPETPEPEPEPEAPVPGTPPSEPPPPTGPGTLSTTPKDPFDAARFLTQASFGPKLAEIQALRGEGAFDTWLQEQRAAPMSLQLDVVSEATRVGDGNNPPNFARINQWWFNSVRGPDQLRQRVAFALSEILVVSDKAALFEPHGDRVAAYHDLLVRGALGNFRTLLEDVTLSQTMGIYLSMRGNQKPDPDRGIRSDENYAREVMQLFTVGLDQLHLDGTPRLDASGLPMPTYNQADIESLARVFTGWSWPALASDDTAFEHGHDSPVDKPMKMYPQYHDFGDKTIIGGTFIPAGLTPEEDLDRALDALFHHPNVGPFIGKQLIQRLATSNPSPAYVSRVASVFNDDGNGVRGNLFAVVRAILLDPEARDTQLADTMDGYGKLREPLLRLTHLWRAFDATNRNETYDHPFAYDTFEQAPLSSPSVFNFFRPTHRPVGPIADVGLVAPEFQITHETTITTTGNSLGEFASAYRGSNGTVGEFRDTPLLDFRPWEAKAADPDLLLEDLSLVLMAGDMPPDMRTLLRDHLAAMDPNEPAERVREAVHLIIVSPQYATQR